MRDWRRFDTILLDMDGTILDLAYDNYFWRELVPRAWARVRGGTQHDARADLFDRYERLQGRLEWYCLDYWTRELSLDLRALKCASSHRMRLLPGADTFLAALRRSGKPVCLVSNAHHDALAIKKGVTGLQRWIDIFVSSHEFGMPKESPAFWGTVQGRLGFDPASTLFIDDSRAVLDAAANAGIAGVLGISRADSSQPARPIEGHATVEGLEALLRLH